MNEDFKMETISRRDFLKEFPKKLLQNIQRTTGGLLDTLTPAENLKETGKNKKEGQKRARVNIEQCLAWGGVSCQFCYLACPLREQAIVIEDQKPVIHPSYCDGCAQCVTACRTVNSTPAIEMVAAK